MGKYAIYLLKQRMEDNSHVIGTTALATESLMRESTEPVKESLVKKKQAKKWCPGRESNSHGITTDGF